MKLNHDCVRDSLLFFENYLTNTNSYVLDPYSLSSKNELLENYNNNDFFYTCLKLKEAEFINADIQRLIDIKLPRIKVYSITWEGHKFLDNIRDDGVWFKTKNVLSEFKSTSISIISNIASKVISEIINKKLGF